MGHSREKIMNNVIRECVHRKGNSSRLKETQLNTHGRNTLVRDQSNWPQREYGSPKCHGSNQVHSGAKRGSKGADDWIIAPDANAIYVIVPKIRNKTSSHGSVACRKNNTACEWQRVSDSLSLFSFTNAPNCGGGFPWKIYAESTEVRKIPKADAPST
jgi:hypothetical protein